MSAIWHIFQKSRVVLIINCTTCPCDYLFIIYMTKVLQFPYDYVIYFGIGFVAEVDLNLSIGLLSTHLLQLARFWLCIALNSVQTALISSVGIFPQVVKEDRWSHFMFHWNSKSGTLAMYKDGGQMYEESDVFRNKQVQEINEGTVKIGDVDFHGEITSLNLWSVDFSREMAVALALNPGNAVGDILSWKSVDDPSGFENGVRIAPSGCHDRVGK